MISTLTLLLSVVAPGDDGPRFVRVDGAVPGPTYWTEGLALADVDHDGDHDVFVARGEGWTNPGRKHPNGLYLNKLEEAPFTFEDVGEERLGHSESHARDVVCADVDGDGWVDALFANAFNTAPPYLFVNRGARRPGHFRNESDTRGLTEAMNSSSAAFGDLDDDGDLDLVLSDAGPVLLGPPGGRSRLYLNDGAGRFAEAPDRLGAPLRVGAMGVHLVDIDGDFDVDLFSPCRTGETEFGHLLLLNDGTGHFADASALLPKTTGGTYEADSADLDGDGDLDLFFTGLARTTDDPEVRFPMGEGPVWNRLAETGALSFETGTAVGVDDDNDVVFVDDDQDGDLDALVVSLGPKEKLFRNDGEGGFSVEAGVVEVIDDPTLDIGVGDLDGDGALDLFTVNAKERIGAEQPPCQVFRNVGPKDARPPRVLGVKPLPDPAWTGAPLVVRARVQDGVVTDETTWIRAEVRYRLDPPAGEVDLGDVEGVRVAAGLAAGTGSFRFALEAPGARSVAYALVFEDFAGNRVVTETYRAALTDDPPRRRRGRRGGG